MEKNVELAKKQELIDKLQKTAQHAPAVRFCYVTSEVAKADIEREWDEIKKQKDLLDQERKNFTDAAIKLGLERGALQVKNIQEE